MLTVLGVFRGLPIRVFTLWGVLLDLANLVLTITDVFRELTIKMPNGASPHRRSQ